MLKKIVLIIFISSLIFSFNGCSDNKSKKQIETENIQNEADGR